MLNPDGYPSHAVRATIDEALQTVRRKRRTRRERAAEQLVDAIAVLTEEGVEPGDAVAFEAARAAVDQYLPKE